MILTPYAVNFINFALAIIIAMSGFSLGLGFQNRKGDDIMVPALVGIVLSVLCLVVFHFAGA